MTLKGDELGASHPVSDDRLLLAIGRATDHLSPEAPSRLIHPSTIARHLGFVVDSATGRRLTPHIAAFVEAGLLERDPRRSRRYVQLTAKGRRRLNAVRRKGDQEPLPESPQHRAWRHGKELAMNNFDEVCALVRGDLAEGTAALEAEGPQITDGTFTSKGIEALAERLYRHVHALALAIYCAFEWPEPDDDHEDENGRHTAPLERANFNRGATE